MRAFPIIALLVLLAVSGAAVSSDSVVSSLKQAIQDNSYNGRAHSRLFNHS